MAQWILVFVVTMFGAATSCSLLLGAVITVIACKSKRVTWKNIVYIMKKRSCERSTDNNCGNQIHFYDEILSINWPNEMYEGATDSTSTMIEATSNEIYRVGTDVIETAPNKVYGISTDGIETTPNEVYGVSTDSIETKPNEVTYGVSVETTPNQVYGVSYCIETTPNVVYGISTIDIEATPNEMYGASTDEIETTPNEVYGLKSPIYYNYGKI